jgi:hypothetical protein
MARRVLRETGALDLRREGETAGETLTRLSTSIQTANGALDILGHSLFNVSARGADAASKLIDAFGGVEQFNSATQSYFQNFYTAEEQLAIRTSRLSDAFADANVRMPRSTEELRRMVEAQDLTTERGRLVYATLMNLSGEFFELDRAATQMAEAATAAERARIDEMRGMSSRIREMATSAIEATFGVSEAQRLAAERQLRVAVQTGQVWGAQLEELSKTAISVNQKDFASSFEFLRATARAAGVLASVSAAQEIAAKNADSRAMAGTPAVNRPYVSPTSGVKRAAQEGETQGAMQTELSEIKGFMRELVRISLKQERTLKEIEFQGQA